MTEPGDGFLDGHPTLGAGIQISSVFERIRILLSSWKSNRAGRTFDLNHDTRVTENIPVRPSGLINLGTARIPKASFQEHHQIFALYSAHRFDLVGTGWIDAGFNKTPAGFEGIIYTAPPIPTEGDILAGLLLIPHQKSAQDILSRLRGRYALIDWQRDHRSGFRWSQKTWFKDIRIGGIPGADIKVPLELCRMNHLPFMSAYVVSNGFQPAEIDEIKNQILDFIAQNPPRMGIAWALSINASIRLINLILAYELLRQNGIQTGAEFDQVFFNSVYEHFLHIFGNLENKGPVINNHYLANLAGMMYACAFLSESIPDLMDHYETLVDEFFQQVLRQFYPDGGNFEASTCYHRFSSEIVLMTAALVCGISGLERIPGEVIQRLHRMFQFSRSILMFNGEAIQVGDNDSGRLIRLTPVGKWMSRTEMQSRYAHLDDFMNLYQDGVLWDENHLDFSPLISLFKGLVETGLDKGGDDLFETCLINSLSGQKRIPLSSWMPPDFPPGEGKSHHETFPFRSSREFLPVKVSGVSLKSGLKNINFHDFGLHLFTSSRLYLAVRTGDTGQNGYGGHGHNDKLSFTLVIDEDILCCDPGSYVYNASIEMRNRFRGVAAHNVPVCGKTEQNRLSRHPFLLKCSVQSRILGLSPDGITIELAYRGIVQVREFTILDSMVRVRDYSNKSFTCDFSLGELVSNGYGKLRRTRQGRSEFD